MEPSGYTVRRATLEDLPALQGLWQVARLPVEEIEKRLTEFQLALRPDGVIMGAIGFRTAGAHGLLHSEAFYSPAQADEARPALWARIKTLAVNHGVARLWRQGQAAPFWLETGFQQAIQQDLNRLPAPFGSAQSAWLTNKLHDEQLISGKLEKEFEAFHLEQQKSRDQLRRQALFWKWIAGLITVGFLGGAVILLMRIVEGTARRRRR